MGREIHRGLACFSLLLSSGPVVKEAHADIPSAERAALIALYDSTNGGAWTDRTNWRNAEGTAFNDPGTECTWYGVTCTGDNVSGINLRWNDLSGPLPSEIGSLTELTTLWSRTSSPSPEQGGVRAG